MLTSWSEVSTPAELSMASVLTSPPASAYSIRPRWVRPRLPPSPTTRPAAAARRPAPRRWPCRRRRRCDSLRGLDVGADAAVPEQVDRRGQDRADQLGRRQRQSTPSSMPSAARTCGESGTDLAAARVDAAARPRSATGRSRPRTSGAARTAAAARRSDAAASGSGSRNTCRWSNAATSRICRRQQHPVAEHVAGHVADADHGEVVGARCRCRAWRKWRLTDSHAPRAVMPISLWS